MAQTNNQRFDGVDHNVIIKILKEDIAARKAILALPGLTDDEIQLHWTYITHESVFSRERLDAELLGLVDLKVICCALKESVKTNEALISLPLTAHEVDKIKLKISQAKLLALYLEREELQDED